MKLVRVGNDTWRFQDNGEHPYGGAIYSDKASFENERWVFQDAMVTIWEDPFVLEDKRENKKEDE